MWRLLSGRLRAVSELVLCIAIGAQLGGCAGPAQRVDERAADLHFRRVVVQGEGFSHVAYVKDLRGATGTPLHIYVEGDGTPWTRRGMAASDPTARSPLMLELMALDPAPSIYLGRPCYHGAITVACTPDVWTDGRYSEAVVASMSAALERLSNGYQALVLLGHSGGGTLALLMAERLPAVDAVITVAANLDIERWVMLHKWRPLLGSLNPAGHPPLPSHIRQMHYAGARDDNVPPTLVRDAAMRQAGASFRVFPEQDHGCCWKDVWPEVLAALPAE